MNSNPYFNIALEYIKTKDLCSMASGKYVIDGDNLWLNIVESKLRTSEEAKLEAHDRYIDIQIPLSGAESFGIKDRKYCIKPTGEFDYSNDIVFFEDKFDEIKTLAAGEMIVFTPETAHAPLIGDGKIKKAIFKVLNI